MRWGDIPDWAYDAAKSILQMLKLKDPMTYHHCRRVSVHCRNLARAVGLNEYEQAIAEFAGLFHDVGKIGISDSIIHKPARLTDEEFKKMEEHPILSVQTIQPLSKHSFFRDIIPGVQHHHERIDGTGYPFRLKGDSIPLAARLILIVDTYDAMSQNRAYRKGLPDDVIYKEIERCSGTQFDPHLAKLFIKAHQQDWKNVESELHLRLAA